MGEAPDEEKITEIADRYGDIDGTNFEDKVLKTEKGNYEIKLSDIWVIEKEKVTAVKEIKPTDYGKYVNYNVDYDNDGIDDYTDIMLGARKDAQNMPKYKSAYYAGGYPPDNEGVCTDLVWRALKNAGYSLKDLVDEDIKNNLSSYEKIEKPDPNIDFRRVYNLKVFFDRNTNKLTNNVYEIAQWQPGDIVIFEESHIGIISDKRNKKGIPYLIHNTAQPVREEDVLERYKDIITGHYRWN